MTCLTIVGVFILAVIMIVGLAMIGAGSLLGGSV